MKTTRLVGRAAAFLACIAASSVGPALSQNDGIVWLEDYGEALRLANETHKPIFVEFRCEP